MWSRLVSLSQLLASLTRILDAREEGEDRYAIVEVGQDKRYVQFSFGDEDVIYAEAVGSYYLEADGRRGANRATARLARMGWARRTRPGR